LMPTLSMQLMAKITKWYHVSKVIGSGSRWNMVARDLKEQYGDYVRTGPRELTVFDANAINATNGPGSKCSKGTWYEAFEGNLQGYRDKTLHRRRRKVWDNGFSRPVLNGLAPQIISETEILLDKLSKETSGENKAIEITTTLSSFAFDIMNIIAFGKNSDILCGKNTTPVPDIIHGAQAVAGYITPIPWITSILKAIPGMMGAQYQVDQWAWNMIQKRKAMKDPPTDLMTYLLDENIDPKGPKIDETLMTGEGKLIVIAGTDTTSATLSMLFLHLALDQDRQKTLQEAIDDIFFSAGQNFTSASMFSNGCTYLEAVINETLRLHPAVQSGVQRETPPEGLTIGDTFIPGKTSIWCSNGNIARDPRYFASPDEFLPERWTTNTELVYDKNASVPFQIGPYSCVGKNVALMEMRAVVVQVLRHYSLSLPVGFDEKKWFDGCLDTFTTTTPKLDLVFNKRSM